MKCTLKPRKRLRFESTLKMKTKIIVGCLSYGYKSTFSKMIIATTWFLELVILVYKKFIGAKSDEY